MFLSLENKFTAKFSLIEERLNKDEDEIYKLKRLEKLIEETRNNLKTTDTRVLNNNEQIKILFAKFEDLKIFTQNINDTNESNNLENLEELKKIKIYFEEKIFE